MNDLREKQMEAGCAFALVHLSIGSTIEAANASKEGAVKFR